MPRSLWRGPCSSRASRAPARRSSRRRSPARSAARCTSGTSSPPARRSRDCTNTTPSRACAIRSWAMRACTTSRNYILKGRLWEAFESEVRPGAAHRRDRQGRHRVSERSAARARSDGVLCLRDARAHQGAPSSDHPHHQQQREGAAGCVPAPLFLPLHPLPGRRHDALDRRRAFPGTEEGAAVGGARGRSSRCARRRD